MREIADLVRAYSKLVEVMAEMGEGHMRVNVEMRRCMAMCRDLGERIRDAYDAADLPVAAEIDWEGDRYDA